MGEDEKMVAITGASGYIGARLLRHLQDRLPGRLLALDVDPLPLPIFNTAVRRFDVSNPFDDLLSQRGVTTLVHLAFRRNTGGNQAEIEETRETNLRTLQMALSSCLLAQVKHFIFLSSHTVYGARRDNPIPLTERSPLRASPHVPSAYDNYWAEQILRSFTQSHAEVAVTVLRCCPALGPGAKGDLSAIFSVPRPMALWGYNPPCQFLHEDDLARALTVVIERGTGGVFNVAGEGVAFLREVADALPDKLRFWPPSAAYAAVALGRWLGPDKTRNAAHLDLVKYPLALSTGRLKQATDWRPRHTSLETLTAFANGVLA